MTAVEESLGDRIRQARERIRMPNGRRMTQGELAAAVEVERNTVSRWENGDVQPNKPGQLLRLARVLRVPIEWLIEGAAQTSAGPAQPEVAERQPETYPQQSSEMPASADALIASYLARLERAGCTASQVAAALSLFAAVTRNGIARTPPDERPAAAVVADADAAWDLIVGILRRDGIRV